MDDGELQTKERQKDWSCSHAFEYSEEVRMNMLVPSGTMYLQEKNLVFGLRAVSSITPGALSTEGNVTRARARSPSDVPRASAIGWAKASVRGRNTHLTTGSLSPVRSPPREQIVRIAGLSSMSWAQHHPWDPPSSQTMEQMQGVSSLGRPRS
eukprot:799848-Rhodomonas_salina.2